MATSSSSASSPLRRDLVTSVDAALAGRVRALFDRALPLDLHDDRFDGWPRTDGDAPLAITAAMASIGERLVGFVGGPLADGVAQIDAIIDPNPTGDDGEVRESGDLDPGVVLTALVDTVEPALRSAGANRIELWAKPAQPWHQALAEARSLEEIRALHQMRCPLPVDIDPIPSRAFRTGDDADLDSLRSVNNRAFHAHPDQGSQTTESLLASMAEPWFDPEGLRLHERDGRLAGFCWTKIHQPRSPSNDPTVHSVALGEIYVIGVDPDYHGQGLGAPMTSAGLDWLHQQGLTTGMLYVEADNTPAVRTYERLGFDIVRTDRAWLLA